MAGWIAQDSFVGESPEGAWLTAHKGQWFPDNDPLVKLDQAAAEAAAKAGVSRSPLFAPLDTGEEEAPPAPPAVKAAKAAPSRKGT